jgi:putative addiction module CopG family antidote
MEGRGRVAVYSCSSATVIDVIVFNPTQHHVSVLDMPMRSTQQFSVTLPNEMAQMVKTKVSSGEYASESEVIRDGLRALQARDKALDTWLRTEVAAAYDELKEDPSKGRTPEQVLASLRGETERQLKAQ